MEGGLNGPGQPDAGLASIYTHRADHRTHQNRPPLTADSPTQKHQNQTTKQLGVAGYLAYIGETNYALALLALILPQVRSSFYGVLIADGWLSFHKRRDWFADGWMGGWRVCVVLVIW